MRRAAGRLLCLPQHRSGAGQGRSPGHAGVFRPAAEGGACCGGAGRSLRHRTSRANLLRHLDRGTGARPGPDPPLYRPVSVTMPPIRLTPSLREKVWGRTRLAPWFPDPPEPVGEAWYLADRELPLLVKLIFTSERLSVQVHPDDGEAGPRGKTEMWYILEADPGASIALGFR